MANYIISCSSTADLTKEHFASRKIHYLCFHYELDGISYPDDLGTSISFEDFYEKMRQGATTKTYQINSDEFITYFTKFLEAGYDILHVTLSSGISGVYNSAYLAKEELQLKYPDRKIVIVDSLGASSGYGMLMDKLADLRDDGKTIEELEEWVKVHRLELHHWFFSTDLSYYVRGGRISKAEGWFGTALHICPLLNMDSLGKLTLKQKIIGKKRVIRAISEKMEKHVQNGLDYNGTCYISHSDCYEDAKKLSDIIESRFPKLHGRVRIYSVGTTIGSHTGPGTVALFFWGDKRTESESENNCR